MKSLLCRNIFQVATFSCLLLIMFLTGCAKNDVQSIKLQPENDTMSVSSAVKAPLVEPPTVEIIKLDPLHQEFLDIKRDMPRMLVILNEKGMPPNIFAEKGLTVWSYDSSECIRKFAFTKKGDLAWAELLPKDGRPSMKIIAK